MNVLEILKEYIVWW